jgi:flavorubredoxin
MDISLRENIYWVGYVDWTVRDFHGYSTNSGSSYNAYLIVDEKPTVIDAVKAPYAHLLIDRVAALQPLDRVAYIVCNHAEPDHSGGLPALVAACPQAEVVCNQKCREALGLHYDTADWRFKLVADGDSLSIGANTLQFINTPMVHWPESMFTYMPEQKLLFSMDAFGQHYASAHRFDDEEPFEKVMHEAKTYFANIVMLYDKPIQRTLAKAGQIEIETIAPSHGVIWRRHVKMIIDKYLDWLIQRPSAKVLVAYDTMWQSTELMAKAIMDGVLEAEVDARLINLREGDFTALATEVLDSAVLAVGSPTLNKTLMPQAAAALTYLKGLAPKDKAGFAFGSYGWSSGGAQDVERYLQEMKVEILREALTCRFAPKKEVFEECRAAGRMLAAEALKKHEQADKERE